MVNHAFIPILKNDGSASDIPTQISPDCVSGFTRLLILIVNKGKVQIDVFPLSVILKL